MSLRDLIVAAFRWAEPREIGSEACRELSWRCMCLCIHSNRRSPETDKWFRQSYTGRYECDGGQTVVVLSFQQLALIAGLPEDMKLAIDSMYNEEY